MMYIQYTIHTFIEHIVDNLLHAVHPLMGNAIVFIKMRIPRDRHSDGLEPCLCQLVHQFAGSLWLSPSSLVGLDRAVGSLLYEAVLIVVATFKRIAEIPAYAHIADCLMSILKRFLLSIYAIRSRYDEY